MPKMNRIRVANIQYDGKIIRDLHLNCYGGENVLLNLANGGGKSVLVQLLQQPILPESKIHQREMYSYLSQEHPSYIFIEWKLDNTQKEYLLTGIVMSRQISSEDRNRVRYFTFVNAYKNSNEFDIENIPFIQKNGDIIEYKSYDTCMQLINQKKGSFELNSYGREEQKTYRQKLAEYGIFTEEWKIISKMNENEGGVDELFKDCKTSDSLVNKWILKVISEGNEEEGKELKEMFVSLMEEIIEQEKNIKEKEILEEFKVKIEEQEIPLKHLLEQLEEESKIEADICNTYWLLKNLSEENQEKINRIAEQMMQYQRELEQIEYEEISEEYYKFENNLEFIKEEKEKKLEEVEKQKRILENANMQYRIQKVALLAQKEKESIAKLKVLNLKRAELESESSTDGQVLKIEYTLQKKYKEKVKELNDKINILQKENEQIKTDIINRKKQNELNQEQLLKLSSEIGRIAEKCSQFEQEEKRLFNELQIYLHRNLLDELEEKEVGKVKDSFIVQIENLKRELEQDEKQIESIKSLKEQEEQRQEERRNKIDELGKLDTQNKERYGIFKEQEEQIREILKFHRITEPNIFEKTENIAILMEKQANLKNKIEICIKQINQINEYMIEVNEGGVHTAKEVRRMLENAHIDYITGEEYLKKQDEKFRKGLLEKNPLLPYCFIVTPEDLQKIKELEMKEEASKLSLVITFKQINQTLEKQKKMVQLNEMYFLSIYHQDCFSNNLGKYGVKLEEIENKKKQYEKELQIVEKHIYSLEQFNYLEKDKIQMEQGLVSFEKQIQMYKEEIENAKNQNVQRIAEIEKIGENKKFREKTLEKIQIQQKEFLSYLVENDNYIFNKKEQARYKDEKQKLEQEIRCFTNEIETLESNEGENATQKSALSKYLEETTKKQLRIPKREQQEILPETIEELEVRYEELTKKYDSNRKQLEEQISFWSERLEETRRDKQKDYGDIPEERYITVHYSEEVEDLAKEKIDEEEKMLQYKNEEFGKLNNEYIKISTKFQTIQEALNKLGKTEAVSASQIKGNYDFRKNKIEENKQSDKEKETKLKEENQKIQKQMNSIERNVAVEDISTVIAENEIEFKTIDLPELLKQYQHLKQENRKDKDIIFRQKVQLENNYQNKHRIITAFLENIRLVNAEGDFTTFYFIYEKMLECLNALANYIGVLNMSLQNIEQDKSNILHHAVKQGVMLYQEMKKISDTSKIKIGDRYIQILKIEIPQELKDGVEQRVESHLNYCIQSLREECKQIEDKRKIIETRVANMLSDRQLLNLTLDLEMIRVKLYKFDIENKNSGLKLWEEVIVENSGGQKFIACFALISALIEYTRRKELELKGETDKIEASKVFILDNPFGKTSSKHLLEPMMEISKKFNIQMICLSDLSQSSITDKFTLIYQLALRSGKYTNKSFLMIEDKRVNGEINVDTSLEQVYLRKNIEQLSFLQ